MSLIRQLARLLGTRSPRHDQAGARAPIEPGADPTPQEAAAALREAAHRQEQAAMASRRWPRWAWVSTGIAVAASGAIIDLAPSYQWVTQFGFLLLLGILYAARTRAIGPALGFEVSATGGALRAAGSVEGTVVTLVLIVLVLWAPEIVLHLLHIGHSHLIGGIIGGLLVAFALPAVLPWPPSFRRGNASHVS